MRADLPSFLAEGSYLVKSYFAVIFLVDIKVLDKSFSDKIRKPSDPFSKFLKMVFCHLDPTIFHNNQGATKAPSIRGNKDRSLLWILVD